MLIIVVRVVARCIETLLAVRLPMGVVAGLRTPGRLTEL